MNSLLLPDIKEQARRQESNTYIACLVGLTIAILVPSTLVYLGLHTAFGWKYILILYFLLVFMGLERISQLATSLQQRGHTFLAELCGYLNLGLGLPSIVLLSPS